MPWKVTDYGAMEQWIHHVKTGDLSHERPTNKSDQHLSEDQIVARSKPHNDSLSERSLSPDDQHPDRHETVGIPVVHESREHDSAHLKDQNQKNVIISTVTEPQERSLPHVENSRREIDEEALENSPSEYSVASNNDVQFNTGLRQRVSKLDDINLYELTHDEMIMGVVEAHDRASLHLKELQKSCDAIHKFKDELFKKMFEAECTGQLEGNISEEWRMYIDIAGHVDDYFLRRPDLMQYTKPMAPPELKSRFRYSGYNIKKMMRMMNQGARKDSEGEAIGTTQKREIRAEKDAGEDESSDIHGHANKAEVSSRVVDLTPVSGHPSISLASWELDEESKSRESNVDAKADESIAIETTSKIDGGESKESDTNKDMNDRNSQDGGIGSSKAADCVVNELGITLNMAEVAKLKAKL